MEDNLKLRKAQNEAADCEKEIAEIDNKLASLNVESVSEKEALIKKQTELYRAVATTEGELKPLKVCAYICLYYAIKPRSLHYNLFKQI